MALFGLYTSKKEKEKLEQKKAQENARALKNKQIKLGEELLSTLKMSASKNNNYNKFRDGTISNTIGKLIISPIPENGDNYSLLVRIENFEVGGPNHYNIWQIDVNTQKDHIHVFKCPYGPDNYSPLSSFETKKQELSDLVRNYRLFK